MAEDDRSPGLHPTDGPSAHGDGAHYWRQCVEEAPVAIAMLDRGMRYLAVSDRWRDAYGLGPLETLLGRSHYEVFPEIPERWKRVHERCLAGASERCDEDLFVRADGTRQWLRWAVRPWLTDTGRVGGLIFYSEDITLAREREQLLIESERRLRQALDASAAGTWSWDAKTNRSTWDARSHEQFGDALSDAMSFETWVALLHPDDRPRVVERLDHVMKTCGDDEWDLEFRVVHRDGAVRWIHGRGRATRDEEGCLVSLGGINLDVTAQKNAEEALQRTRDLEHQTADVVRLLLETAAQGIVSVDAAGTIVTANAAVASMFGWTVEELVGQSIERLLPLALRDAHERHRADYFEAPRPRPMGRGLDLVGERRDGTTFPVEVSLNHVATPTGGRAIAFVTDITERKRAATRLAETNERLSLALDAASAGTWTLDFETDRIHADERLGSWLDVAHGPAQGLSQLLARVHPSDRPRIEANIEAVRHGRDGDGWNFEYRVILPDGRLCWIQSLARAERDQSGRARRISGIALDVTTRKAAEEEAHRSHLALEDRTRELERRTAQLSRLATELTLAEQHAREQLAKTLHDHLQQLLFSATLKLDRLAMRASRGESGADLAVAARSDIDDAIAAARSLSVELFPPALHERGLPAALEWLGGWMRQKYGLSVRLVVDPAASPDRKDIRILLFESVRELLFNVVKHGKCAHAEVQLAAGPDDTLVITVSDQGAGFDPERVFAQGDHHPEGFGLFSIRERVALLGGRLDVESAPSDGARFRLVAPRDTGGLHRTVQAPAAVTEVVSSAAPPASEGGNRPLRIVIADDHALVRKGLRELLADRAELQVVGEAVDGLEAIAQAHALRPDVIVMDVSMPRMDGVEATRQIRTALPFIEVFGLSTHERTGELQAIEQAGAAGYFAKGEDTRDLVGRLLAEHARRRT